MVQPTMLPHRTCPQCGAENLADEPVCFACGASATRRPARVEGPLQTPWVLYLGALAGLALVALVLFYLSRALGSYREQAAVPPSGMLLLALALVLFGQYGFRRARREERSRWELTRAPQLPMKGTGPGDDVWLRGTIVCEAPLWVPYLSGQQCVYYELTVRQRDEDRQGGWRTTQHEVQAVDFTLKEGEGSLYVPSGGLTVEAPVCVDTVVESTTRVKVSALLVGWQVSVCGRVADDSPHRRIEQLSEEVPAVVTCQYPGDYLAEVSRAERIHRAAGWIMSALALVLVLATLPRW